MPYYQNPTFTIENGIIIIPNDCIKTIAGNELFAYQIPGTNINQVDNPTNVSKICRSNLEKLASILGVSKATIKDMKKRDLIEYLTPRIVFQRNN